MSLIIVDGKLSQFNKNLENFLSQKLDRTQLIIEIFASEPCPKKVNYKLN